VEYECIREEERKEREANDFYNYGYLLFRISISGESTNIYYFFPTVAIHQLLSEAAVVGTISDEQSLDLFRSVALTNANSKTFRSKTKLTRKQYYSKMSRMIKAGLIKRMNGRYFLTSFGKVVYEAVMLIEHAVKEYWKLKAVDSLEIFDNMQLPQQERNKILDTLIDNQQIKESILKRVNDYNRYS
jgi:hypothetical protein